MTASLRFQVKDPQGVTFSDFDLTEAINKAVRTLYAYMGRRLVYLALKKTVLIVEDGTTRLPMDFFSVSRVYTEGGRECHALPHPVQRENVYRIYGSTFEAPDGTYVMEYFQLPLRLEKSDDALDAPESLREPLINISAALLNGDTTNASRFAEECCDTLAGGNVGHFCNFGPEEIYGGAI